MPRRGHAVVGLAALPAIAGALLLVVQHWTPASTTGGQTLDRDPPPAVIYARQVCSLSNDDASAALVEGADGGASIVVADTTWWLFGDTLFLAASGKQIEQNSIASSTAAHPGGCPALSYYAPDGVALPFLPKDGSLTVWPAGAWPVDDRSFDFYTAYVYGSGPYAYTIGEVGVARLDTSTMRVTVLSRRLWDAESGFASQVIGTQPVELGADGLLRLVLQTRSSDKLLARVPPASLADADAYEYWTGAAWSKSPSAAVPIWRQPAAPGDLQKLASFENGASIAWNAALRKYVALVNIGFSTVGARTADRLEEPWSGPQPWFDCLKIAEPRVPACYSPFQHPQLAQNGGRTIFATISRLSPYAVAFYEFRLGDPIHELRDGDAAAYSPDAGAGGEDQGVAFYASATPQPGFVAVYRWRRGDASRYAPSLPADGFERVGDPAFYAPPSATVAGSDLTYRPVYDWSNGEAHVLSPLAGGLERYGYARGDIEFYAP